jgi:cyclopropane-fatty-acyl-phospholipid synthase
MATVADLIRPIFRGLLGGDPTIRIRCWDGSSFGPSSQTAVLIRRPEALRRLLYAPNELGISRAYVAGDIDVEGDIFEALGLRDVIAQGNPAAEIKFDFQTWLKTLRSARALGGFGPPLPPPPHEARLLGKLHSKRRDSQAVSYHYDVSNEFYRLFLGQSMTYSCAYYETPTATLDDAQTAKLDLVARKLGLRRGMRLLDIGSGWGSMLLHAARHYEVEGVGVTLSSRQADLAAKRVADDRLADRIEIRLLDYRDVDDGPYDAISSIGMFEHVGVAGTSEYFTTLFRLLAPTGRLLNHAISRPAGPARIPKRSFISRYVFPDGELQEVGAVVSAMQRHGFEVRDVESLREHYARTLRQWVANLEGSWETATQMAGLERARIWRLYMAGSALGFEAGRINVHQVLGVKAAHEGTSGMPPLRTELLAQPSSSAL